MISIIICSRTQTISTDLSENIKNTIGCDYELIIVDNSDNTYSIFEAYNIGIHLSVGDYLCFVHDDIIFHTTCWGNSIQDIFRKDLHIGLIGVAGAKSKTTMPSLWWSCPEKDKIMSIIQHIPDRGTERWNSGFEKESLVEVAAVDGVFMATRKDERIRFNLEMTGFHNYDLNLSFECEKLGYKIIVTNEILIEHFSLGTIKKEWVESSYQLYALYKNNRSFSINNKKTNKKQEIANAIWFIKECLKFKKYKIAMFIWKELFCLNPFLLFHVVYWKNNLQNNIDVFCKCFYSKK